MKHILKPLLILTLILSCTVSAYAEPTAEPSQTDEPVIAEVTPTPEPEITDDTISNDTQASNEPSEEADEISPTPSASVSPTPAAAKSYTSTTLDFHINIAYKKYVVDSFIKIEVYDKDNNLVGTDREWIGGVTRKVDLHYDIPEYTLGDTFTVKLVEGAEQLAYYDNKIKPDGTFQITTNYYNNSKGEFVYGNSFNFDAIPLWEKEVVVYVNDEIVSLKPRARIVNDRTLIPVRAVAEAMQLNVRYSKEYDSVVCGIGDDEIIFNLGTTYATFFGKTVYLDTAPCYIQGSAYIPVRPLAEAFKAPLEVKDFGDHLDVIIGESETVREYMQRSPVNKWNISSRTKYMVWVSKSEYTVRVYEGSKNNWTLVYTCPCAIGAPGTPTVTGSFEYIERTRWDYGSYYVGPVLRFYNGYALHSTLLYYGGGEYDGRVGVQISHGCVRMHPQDINWIAATIPLYTRIYITE